MTGLIQKLIKRVAIIGGGPGGLAAARALRDEGSFETITIFERNDHTGGTWKFSEETNKPPPFPSTNALEVDSTLSAKKLYSPIYANLHTNLPHPIMCFQDAPFPPETPYFPSHNHVMNYLNQLAKSENLLPWVKFSSLVTNVVFENDSWKVSVQDANNDVYTEDFDAVVVATGHYAVPFVPDFPGLAELNNNKHIQLLHSREYRHPEQFKDKNILVIGGGSSAIDIVRETATVANKIYQCIRTQTEISRQAVERNPPHVHQIDLIHQIVNSADATFIELQNGQVLNDVDVIIFGTGYLYSFPFMPWQKDNLIKTGQKVHHLDRYMFYQQNPTLCFIGLPIRVVPMPLMQRQSIVMARYWSRKIPMRPHTSSSNDEEKDNRLDFTMGVARECDYNDRLGAWAEGCIDDTDFNHWQSTHPLTGRLPEQWKEVRRNALSLRREYLGY